MDFDNEDLNKENGGLENSYYDADYNMDDDLNRLNNPYYDDNYSTEKDLDRLKNDYYEDDNELLNDNKSEEGNPALGRSNVNEEVKDAKAVGKKKDVNRLMKKYGLIAAISIFSIIFFVGIIMFCLDFDLVGIGNPKPKYYAPPACGKIYLTWENPSYTEARQKVEKDYVPITDASLVDLDEEDQYGVRYSYKEYDYDTYISGIVWTDNYNAKDIDNEVVYQAMVIAARSRMIAELPINCVVLKNYNEQAQSFTELTGSEEKYVEIKQAVAATEGKIIGINNQILSAKYDPFTYVERRKEEDSSFQENFFYRMMQKNNEEQQFIHARWVEELERKKGVKIPKLQVSEVKKFASMSLYGAKYLLEEIDSQYQLLRILKYYYGQNIEYYTIDYAFSGEYDLGIESGCSPISINSTTLSREEFIALVSKYGSRGGGAKILADNAGMIYDMATSNGINPELVFIRADVEGYSPGTSRNNYWGIGCGNTEGIEGCNSYGSLSEGVSAFLRIVSGYTSLSGFSSYAYLGDYWYNPSRDMDDYWGMGGCPYASYIFTEIPERVRNACAQVNTCLPGNTASCIPTTEEERKLYDDYQARSMISARKRIFGLSEDTCETESSIGEPGTGSCTIWKQGDSRWGSLNLGSSKSTMKGAGCAVTSVAIAISCSGTQINNVAAFNPGTLVTHMNTHSGFSGDLINWRNSSIRYFAPNFQYVGKYELSGSASQKVNTVLKYVGNNTSIILKISNEEHSTHFVVFKSVSGTTFTVYDPAYGRVNTYSADDVVRLVLYRY